MLSCFKDYFRQPMKLLCCCWGWLLDLWLVIKPCRFSVISLIIGFVFFGLVPQGIDILRSMTETGPDGWLRLLFFYLCIWLWALSIWYWARQLLRFKLIYERATATENSARIKRMIEEVPRALGALAFWSLWIALLQSGHAYSDSAKQALTLNPTIIAYVYFFSGIVFYLFARSRRWLLGRMLDLPDPQTLHEEHFTSFRQMPRVAQRFALILTVISLIALFWTSIDPVRAHLIGTQNLLLIAAANWVFIGTLMVFIGEKFRLPVFLMLFLLAFIFSAWNDNHAVRTTETLQTDNRETINNHFSAWLEPRLTQWRSSPENSNKPFPLFLVAAEGGGIRAAYWSASVLSALQDANPQFAKHIYAMSGVSGGSLGVATFAAMLKAKQTDAEFTEDCFEKAQFSYQNCSRAYLRNDFLAPPIGRMLYGDLIQRFLPFPVPFFDRATALEKSWEESWQTLTNTDIFNDSLLDLYVGNENPPLLFLNTTWVEKGYRAISAPVRLNEHLSNLKDMHVVTQEKFRLSTAVHNSARFTYVSPAGRVITNTGEVWGHIVDGGYFENSGAETLAEVFQAIRSAAGDRWDRILPIVLMLTNDPLQDDQVEVEPSPMANELRSPINALLNTRGGRGALARADMKQLLSAKGIFKEFGLQHIDGPVPLGWVLSDAAMQTMDKRLNCYLDELPGGDPLNLLPGLKCNSQR